MNTMDRPTAALGLSPPQPAEHSAEQFEQFHQPALEQPGQQFQQFQQPAPAMQVIHPASPALQPALRRSVRPTRGQTDRYKDFVQHIGPYQQTLPEPYYQYSPQHWLPNYNESCQHQFTHLPQFPQFGNSAQQAVYQIQCQQPMMTQPMMPQPMMTQPMMTQPMMTQPIMMCYIMADGHN